MHLFQTSAASSGPIGLDGGGFVVVDVIVNVVVIINIVVVTHGVAVSIIVVVTCQYVVVNKVAGLMNIILGILFDLIRQISFDIMIIRW